jgi:hypothetical protein
MVSPLRRRYAKVWRNTGSIMAASGVSADFDVVLRERHYRDPNVQPAYRRYLDGDGSQKGRLLRAAKASTSATLLRLLPYASQQRPL